MLRRSEAASLREQRLTDFEKTFRSVHQYDGTNYRPVMESGNYNWDVVPANDEEPLLSYVRTRVSATRLLTDPMLELLMKNWERGNRVRFVYKGSCRPLEAVEDFANFLKDHDLPYRKTINFKCKLDGNNYYKCRIKDVELFLLNSLRERERENCVPSLYTIVCESFPKVVDAALRITLQTAMYKDYTRMLKRTNRRLEDWQMEQMARDRPISGVAPMSTDLTEDFRARFDLSEDPSENIVVLYA